MRIGQLKIHNAFILSAIAACLLLTGCQSKSTYAPVVNAWQTSRGKASEYRVRKGDTLYSIAWAFGMDYRTLAEANNLRPPYTLEAGQLLRMSVAAKAKPRLEKSAKSARPFPTTGTIASPTLRKSSKAKTSSVKKGSTTRKQTKPLRSWPQPRWRWPTRGKVVQGYSTGLAGNKGINISGRLGQPVRASAAGTVVYSGDGVRGYGNLIIIKHNDSYLSAYAFNQTLKVRLGQHVRAGQVIATMGRDTAGKVMLHFEIRKNGRPVNPLRYLPK